MQKEEMDVEASAEGDLPIQDGREYDGCMAEDHRDGKTQKDGMQHRVIDRAYHDPAEKHREYATHTKPQIA
jgi:hypothetical protein